MSSHPELQIPEVSQLREFETLLDSELAKRALYSFDANQTLMLACNMSEAAAATRPFEGVTSAFHDGIISFAAQLTSGRPGKEPDLETLASDLLFGAHYHHLRELLYYSYNAPGSIGWSFSGGQIQIRFADRSIPRQFYTTWNEWCLLSLKIFDEYGVPDELRNLLKETPEFEITAAHSPIDGLLREYADLKLSAYFSILDPNSDIDLGGYSYRGFISVYRILLMKALYHRSQSEANKICGCVWMDTESLPELMAQEANVEVDQVRNILQDIVYDQRAVRERTDASYFSLMREGAPPFRTIMRPFDFSKSEGLVQLLRVVAQRQPTDFLSNVSNQLGEKFVQRVKNAFQVQGFTCLSEVSLGSIDPKLPDIDLLVISEEPTLGFVLFVCELKSPLPPRWAKDQLRVFARDGVSKAFRQNEAIRAFLARPEGVKFIRSMLPERGLEHFDEFLVIVHSLIVTSDNAGMFFEQEQTPILNFRTLERLLERSDGDVLQILQGIRTYKAGVEKSIKTTVATVALGDIIVSYEGVTSSELIDFPQNRWRSGPERQDMIDSFIADGHHPFDCLEEKDFTVASTRDLDLKDTD